jgi:hypothetical protein
MNQRDSIKMTPEQALAYLTAHHSCALATNGHDVRITVVASGIPSGTARS